MRSLSVVTLLLLSTTACGSDSEPPPADTGQPVDTNQPVDAGPDAAPPRRIQGSASDVNGEGAGIPGVQICINELPEHSCATTDGLGEFEMLDVPAVELSVTFAIPGYERILV